MFLIFRVDKSNTMSMDLTTLKSRVNNYHEILGNIKSFRQDWEKTLKLMIIKTLEEAIKETKLSADIVIKDHTTMDLAKLLKPGDLIVVNNTK